MKSNESSESGTKYFKLKQSNSDKNTDNVCTTPPNTVAPTDADKIAVFSSMGNEQPRPISCLQQISQLFCFRDTRDTLSHSNVYKPTTAPR